MRGGVNKMKPYYESKRGQLYHGDCLEVMRQIPESSIDGILTDPPYGLSFMGKKWDYDVPSVEIWRECLRVLKPGAHALIFAGSRTQHRMAVNVEDAGFILKDCLMYLYGSGFPKSTNISKQIDKKKQIIVGFSEADRDIFFRNDLGGRRRFDLKNWTWPLVMPSTPQAELWNGMGTHLKPSYETVLLVMKPNDGTYANNALKHGVAGIHIDGCRIEVDPNDINRRPKGSVSFKESSNGMFGAGDRNPAIGGDTLDVAKGRFPANVILDEEAARLLDEQSGFSVSKNSIRHHSESDNNCMSGKNYKRTSGGHQDQGGASRFFFCAKASAAERNAGCEGLQSRPGGSNAKGYTLDVANGIDRNRPTKNTHPTVKPLKLIEYLLNLLNYPGDPVILDPFGGSGTFGVASEGLKRRWIMCEKEEKYCEIAAKRIESAASQTSFEDFL